ncbi:MAG TPA: UbiA-like polyprenyltransferase [Flavisolibacter sp.]|nr:UbiA-like polyprenyltransferase [Flavisolibacter sp.]
MSTIKNYLSLIKFSHTIFAMPFALIGFFIGTSGPLHGLDGQWNLNKTIGWRPDNGFWNYSSDSILYKINTGHDPYKTIGLGFLLVVLCMVFARSAAMAFNRYLDRRWDAMNPRTAVREIPRGIISPGSALAFTIINCLLFITATWFINRTCFYLSPVALAVVLGYSYTKRFTALCHIVLGLGLSLAPIGAYLAVTGMFHWLPLLFSIAVLCWVSGFDIIYALQDVDFDRSQELYSIPAWLGKSRALRVSEGLHLLSALVVVLAGFWGGFGWLYWIGVCVFCGCLVYQHSVVKPNDLRRVNLAFMTANGIASVVFALFVISDLFLA